MTPGQPDSSAQIESPKAPPPFLCKQAETSGPFVFALPHSGRFYPPSMRLGTNLSDHELRLSEDAFVDHLFEHTPAQGATLLVATHARAYLDLNRSANEIDPYMFEPALQGIPVQETHRVKAGLGIIPKLVAENVQIYSDKLPAREAAFRINNFYHPYHARLRALTSSKQKQFGYAVLIDCHSMPSEKKSGRRGHASGPDIVLGDNWGSSCARELTSLAEDLLISAGFSVRRNVPYSGGFTTQHYGEPNKAIHALQIEINRAIYMDQEKLEPLDSFEDIKKSLGWVTQNLIDRFTSSQFMGRNSHLPNAAE